MVAKKRATPKRAAAKKPATKGALKLSKETVKTLKAKGKGPKKPPATTGKPCSNPCPKTVLLCPHKTTVPAGCNPTVVK